jgi:hypothetical protein
MRGYINSIVSPIFTPLLKTRLVFISSEKTVNLNRQLILDVAEPDYQGGQRNRLH